MNRLVILDNEAVQVLANPGHSKHRRVMSHVAATSGARRGAVKVSLAVPTAVRAEAGWDRTSPAWAFLNHLKIADLPLDAEQANNAARIRSAERISVADAHVGAAVQASSASEVTVLTSDPGDIRRAAGDHKITIVTI